MDITTRNLERKLVLSSIRDRRDALYHIIKNILQCMQRKLKQHQYQQNELYIANHLKDKEKKSHDI
jgi:hypothetical protein